MMASPLKDKKVAVLGLGVDTADILPWLKKQRAKITILDEKKGDTFSNLSQYHLVIRSPGVYRFRKELIKAERAGVEISSKIKIFFDQCLAKTIGVTGTKGKGTTATLIYEILKAAGRRVHLGGNIGSGIFGTLGKLTKEDWVILELSSFQLIDLHKSPHIGVVLMVTSEHLNWHKSAKEYVMAKANIVSHQVKGDFAVVNKDYFNSRAIGKLAKGKLFWVSSKQAGNSKTKLRGNHNMENIAAAIKVAKIAGVPARIISKVISEFKGLEHRLEEVATVNGVTFYNDSFSTTPETAIAAVKSFTEPIIAILGGSSKNSDFKELGKIISESSNVKAIILIGVEGPRIGKEIRNKTILAGGSNMSEIIEAARAHATVGDVVLLSPACASFDMFKNYKHRGQLFKAQVNKIATHAKK